MTAFALMRVFLYQPVNVNDQIWNPDECHCVDVQVGILLKHRNKDHHQRSGKYQNQCGHWCKVKPGTFSFKNEGD